MADEVVLLLQGPASGDTVTAAGPTVVVGAHLYTADGNRAESEGRWLPAYRHATDCCDPHSGSQDGCE
jgi:hypothetical protein